MNYSKMGPAIQTPTDFLQLLRKLSLHGSEPVDGTARFQNIEASLQRSHEAIVVTYCLFLYMEHFPSLAPAELRSAEFRRCIGSLKIKNGVSNKLLGALRKTCTC